ncbi:MAG TPA: hypothetical protein VFL83_10925 [Anaeromyxobacter sp.]|nr:hypothetical protein [Anaeromyxobacter sp.]
MLKSFVAAAAVAAAAQGFAQQQQPQSAPPQQQPQGQQAQPAPAQPPAPSGSTAGSQGQSSAAQPGSPGASSQQVVVNPPPSQQPSTTPPPPPSSTTVVNPPPGAYRQDTVVVEERYRPSPFAIVATDAAWGGLVGLLVGFGVTLVDEFDDWDRDLMVGAGIGVLAGAAVGVAHAAYEAREADRRRRVVYGDGMNRTDRDPLVTTGPTLGFAFRF